MFSLEKTLKDIGSLRKRESNKGTYGHAYILGGSLAYAGAPYLSYSASAAYRGGVGYAHLALPKSLLPAYMLKDPQAILSAMPEKDGFLAYDEESLSTLLHAKGIAFGMGAGNKEDTAKIAVYLLKKYHGVLLLDADALNALAKYGYTEELASHVGSLIITPHLLEFSRLSNLPVEQIEKEQEKLSTEFAKKWNGIVVLKSHYTYISDGMVTNKVVAGNSGLAKAGSGDLLSGLIVGFSWACPEVSSLEIATLGSELLGKAAEYVAEKYGGNEFMTTAFDIVNAIPKIIEQYKTS